MRMAPKAAPITGITLALALAPACAEANPDVWIEVAYLLRFDETALTDIESAWVFDPFLSSRATAQFDTDQDGAFSQAEAGALRAALFDPLAEAGYFLRLVAGERPRPTRLKEFRPNVEEGRLTFRFSLTPETPLVYRESPIALATHDPETYYDFTLAEGDFLRVDGPFDPACRFQVGPGAIEAVSQSIMLRCQE